MRGIKTMPTWLTTSKYSAYVEFGYMEHIRHCVVPLMPSSVSETLGPFTLSDTHDPMHPCTFSSRDVCTQ